MEEVVFRMLLRKKPQAGSTLLNLLDLNCANIIKEEKI